MRIDCYFRCFYDRILLYKKNVIYELWRVNMKKQIPIWGKIIIFIATIIISISLFYINIILILKYERSI